MSASSRPCGNCARTVKSRIGGSRQHLIPRVKRLFTRRCLLKTVFCCVRVSNHVPCRRVASLAWMPQVAVLALMSVGFAGCSADMQTRLSDSSFSNPFASQPEATGSVRTPAVERREQPQYARPQASAPQFQSQALPAPAAVAPSAYPASSGGVSEEGAGFRPMRRRPFADRDHRHGAAALGRRRAPVCAERRHDHCRYQRHARWSGQALQRFSRRDPAGQWLQGPARAVARPAMIIRSRPPWLWPHRRSRRRPASRLPQWRGRRASMSSIAAIR